MDWGTLVIIGGVIVLILAIAFCAMITTVPSGHVAIIESFGVYHSTLEPGVHLGLPWPFRSLASVPVRDSGNSRVKGNNSSSSSNSSSNYRTHSSIPTATDLLYDIEPIECFTSDRVAVSVDIIVDFRITDPRLYVYGSENTLDALESKIKTILVERVGELTVDTISTKTLNGDLGVRQKELREEVKKAWGIDVKALRVENVEIPESITEAAEVQVAARHKAAAARTAQESEHLLEVQKVKTQRELDKQKMLHEAELQEARHGMEIRQQKHASALAREQAADEAHRLAARSSVLDNIKTETGAQLTAQYWFADALKALSTSPNLHTLFLPGGDSPSAVMPLALPTTPRARQRRPSTGSG